MNPTLITDLLTYALPSGFLAGTVTWLVSRRKRRNDMLADMQRSIDLLCEKYNDVLQENVTLRREKADWLICAKGIERGTHAFLSDIVVAELPDAVASILSGLV